MIKRREVRQVSSLLKGKHPKPAEIRRPTRKNVQEATRRANSAQAKAVEYFDRDGYPIARSKLGTLGIVC